LYFAVKLNIEGGMLMSKREDYENRTEKLLEPIVAEHEFEIVDVEYIKEGSNWYLRAYIDKPGGITIDDLEMVSRALSDKLDEEDFISDAYILEVSSPGLGRPLKKEKDFKRSMGEEVEVFLYKAINKQKQFVGLLKAYDNEGFTIETESGEEMTFNKKEVALVRLSIDF
jgi:ribosome maturation factor RimP